MNFKTHMWLFVVDIVCKILPKDCANIIYDLIKGSKANDFKKLSFVVDKRKKKISLYDDFWSKSWFNHMCFMYAL